MPRFFLFYWLFLLCGCSLATRNRLRQSVIGRHRKFATAEFEERGSVTGYSTEIVQAVLQEADWRHR
jgi:ABC-type branched-subunit amino acid transport system permease subunit